MADDRSGRGVDTVLAHAGNDPRDFHGFVNPPLARASTVLFPDAETLESARQKYTYGTHATPTTDALTDAVDLLEGSAGTILAPSGLAAVTVSLLAFLKAGDHLLATDAVYYPTRRFCETTLRDLGVETTWYDPCIGAGIEALIRPRTRIVFTESPGSNTMEMQDVPAIAAAARRHGAVVMMDNTWATPLLFRPLDHGVDVSIHAATKYPAGHADVLLGLVSANEAHIRQLLDIHTRLGVCAGPEEAYQTLRGLRTMGIRLARHQASALEIARQLENAEGVAQVLHPALASHPGHWLWKRDYAGASGLFSIVLDGGPSPGLWRDKAHAFLDALRIFGLGYSWGGYASLALHARLHDRTIAAAPGEGPVIRLQIGLEDAGDLYADIELGLAAARRVR